MGRGGEDVLEAIRALLYDPPSEVTWGRLWRVLSAAPVKRLEGELLPYVVDHLTRWPAGLRVAPTSAREVFFDAGRFERIKPSVRLLLPLIDNLNLPQTVLTSERVEALTGNPLCANLTHLDLLVFNPEAPAEFTRSLLALSEAAHFTKVLALTLSAAKISTDLARPLLDAPWFRRLSALGLKDVKIEPFEGPVEMPLLESLKVDRGSSGLLEALGRAGSRHALRSLEVHGALGEAEGRAIAGMTSLRRLNLEMLWESKGLGVLAEGRMPELEALELRYGGEAIKAGLAALLVHEDLKGLRHLELRNNALVAEDLAPLRVASFEQLESLILRYNAIKDEGLGHILGAPFLGALKRLDLSGVGLGREGVSALAQAEGLVGLKRLELKANGLGGALGILSGPVGFSGLEVLMLGGNGVDDAVMAGIDANPSLGALERLGAMPCDLSVQAQFGLMTDPRRRWSRRRASMKDLVGRLDRAALLVVLGSEGVTTAPEERTKPLLVGRLIEAMGSDSVVARVLCHRSALRFFFSARGLKATLRAAGVQGYSKWARKALEEAVLNVIGAQGAGLLEPRSP